MTDATSPLADAELLLKEQHGDVVLLTLNRPGRLNVLDEALIDRLESEVVALRDDERVRAVVITGAGGAFCAGADVRGKDFDPVGSRRFLTRLNRLFDDLEALPQPTVAAIGGPAVAGGLELALACTFRVASLESRLGLPEVDLGLVVAGGGTRRLPRLVGLGRALELCLLGDLLQAEEAARIGLVNRVCPRGGHREEGLALARRLAEGPPLAQSLMKDALYANAGRADGERLLEILSASVNHATLDSKEGLSAFFEKRRPRFRGL